MKLLMTRRSKEEELCGEKHLYLNNFIYDRGGVDLRHTGKQFT